MKKDSFYTVLSEIGHPEDLIPQHIKIQSLNNSKYKIEQLKELTSDPVILITLNTLLVSIEDAYQIYMYRFQFQLFINVINKEVKNIEEIIAFAAVI